MRTIPAWLRALWRDREGAITILAAAGLVIVMAGGAFAVDLGSIYYESRRLQGVADAAALAAAGNPTTATASAAAAIASQNWNRPITPIVTTGIWTADPAKSVAQRFVVTPANANAAKVQVTTTSPLYFGRIFGISSIQLARTATATRIDLASFSIGTRLASLDGGLANQLLTGLTGSNVSLSVADYNALLGADVDLLSYVDALKTELNVGAVSYDTVLSTTTTLPHVLKAFEATLNAAGNAAAAAAVAKISATAPPTAVLPSALVNLGQIGGQDRTATGISIDANAYTMLQSILQIAGGARQVNLNLGASIPGLAGVTATVVIGDRMQDSPWIALTNTGNPIVSTAQTRIYLQASALGGSALSALGIASVRLPLYVELAPAQARLSSLNCSQAGRTAALDVQTGIGHVSIADVNPLALSPMSGTVTENPAAFVNLPGIAKVTGAARVDLSNTGWQTVNFTQAEIDAKTTKTVSSGGVVGAVTTSLIGNIALTATAGPLNLPLPSLGALVKPVLNVIAPLLDGVLSNLLDTLGLHLGQADVRMNGVRCGNAALVA